MSRREEETRRGRQVLIQKLQERNQELKDAILKYQRDWAVNQRIIEELREGEEEDYEDISIEEIEDDETTSIPSIEIIPPPSERKTMIIDYCNRKQRARTSGTLPESQSRQHEKKLTIKNNSKKNPPKTPPVAKTISTTTPKRKTKREERKESLEKARAWAIDRKNAREAKEQVFLI